MRRDLPTSVFVTGTDTGIGKTWVVCQLVRWLSQQGYDIGIQKWVETGWDGSPTDYDSYLEVLPQLSEMPVEDVVPYRLKFPASPHLAARMENVSLDFDVCQRAYNRMISRYECVLVEGAGGCKVPVSMDQTLVDWIQHMAMPIILVVGNQLGCINHTLLTLDVLRHYQLDVQAVVMNDMGVPASAIEQDNPSIISQFCSEKVIVTHGDWCSRIFE